jgi:hypothetical protein
MSPAVASTSREMKVANVQDCPLTLDIAKPEADDATFLFSRSLFQLIVEVN